MVMLALLPTLYCHIFAFFILFAPTDASKFKIGNHGVHEDYISMLNALLDFLIFKGKAKTKLPMLAFLYCGEIVKNSVKTFGGGEGDSEHTIQLRY